MDKFYKYSFKTYSKKIQGNAKALKYYLFCIKQGGHLLLKKSDMSKEDGISI